MTHSEWLAGLAVGDKVIVQRKYHEIVGQVSRLTKTQIIIVIQGSGMAREYKFNRTSGWEIGGGDKWHQDSLEPFTEERERKIQEAELRSRALYAINNTDWSKLTNEELKAVLAALGRAVE